MTTDEPAPTPPLWASDGHRIACRRHLPQPGSDASWANRWRLMSAEEQEGFASSAGHPPACEACVAIDELARLDDGLSLTEQRDETVARLARGLGVDLLRETLAQAFHAGHASATAGARAGATP